MMPGHQTESARLLRPLGWSASLRPVPPEGVAGPVPGIGRRADRVGHGGVEVLRHYIAYRRLVNRTTVFFRPKHRVILVYLRLDPDSIALEEGLTRDMRGVGHLGTGDLEVRVASAEDLDRAGPLIRRAFEAA